MQQIVHILDQPARWLGRITQWFSLIMMALTCIIVLLRYGFDIGSIPTQEAVMYLHGFAFMLAISWGIQSNSHVRVDVLYAKLPHRRQRLIDATGAIVFLLPLGLVLLWTGWSYAGRSWSILEGSPEVSGIPAVFLLKSLIPALGLLLLLQACAEILRNLASLNSDPDVGSQVGDGPASTNAIEHV